MNTGKKQFNALDLMGRPRLMLFAIIIVTVFAYLNSLNNGFVADDNGFVKYNVSIRDLGNLPDFFFNSSKTLAAYDPQWGAILYRPLRTASYALDYSLFGNWAPGFHLTNLILHLISVITVYLVSEALLRNTAVSLLAALLFALHPAHIEAVSWIASRADLIGLIFMNFSLLSYMRYRDGGRKRFLYLSLFFSLLSYLGKETMVSFPGVIILYDVIRERKGLKEAIRSNYPSWFLFSALCLAYLVFRFSMTGRMSTAQSWWGGTPYTNFLMMIEATAVYIKLMLFPFKLSLHYIIMPVKSFFEAGVIVSALVVLLTFGMSAYFFKRDRRVFFLLAWFYIGLIPIANIIPNSFSMMAERYIYMPSMGPIIAMALGIHTLYLRTKDKSPSLAKAVTASTAFLVVFFFLMTVDRNKVYKDEFAFYSAAVSDSPYSAASRKSLADQYAARNDFGNALIYYDKALSIDPNFPDALIKKALIYGEQGRSEEAIRLGTRAEGLKPKDPQIRFMLGDVYRLAGDMGQAAEKWRKAIELYPDYAEAYNNLGGYYLVEGDYAKAIEMYEKSLGANPSNAETYYNMALAYEAKGDSPKARANYLNFIKYAGPELKDMVEEVKRKL